MISSTTSGAAGALWGQLQQQQAQRTAEQAEQRARALQAQARSAQSDADRAQENARSLSVESDQAQGDARTARQNVSSLASLDTLNSEFGALREQIAKVTQAAPVAASPVAPTTFTNSSGQETGTLINVTA